MILFLLSFFQSIQFAIQLQEDGFFCSFLHRTTEQMYVGSQNRPPGLRNCTERY